MTQNAINAPNTLVQFVYTNTTSRVTCNTVTPYDDTIPQNTEGNEVLTLAITPTSANSTLEIYFSSNGSEALLASNTVALFQDSTADALSAKAFNQIPANGCMTCSLLYKMTAGTTSATTFKIRIGVSTSTYYVNGTAAGRKFGGVASTFLTIKEYI